MKTMILLLVLFIATNGLCAVVKSLDQKSACTLYRVVTEQTPMTSNEVTIFEKDVYGLTFKNMEVDFLKKQVLVDPMMNVVLGINRSLIPQKAFISSENPDFTFLINQLNRKLYVFEKMCISDSSEIIYASMFEAQ